MSREPGQMTLSGEGPFSVVTFQIQGKAADRTWVQCTSLDVRYPVDDTSSASCTHKSCRTSRNQAQTDPHESGAVEAAVPARRDLPV